jgi:hypothetical protein
MPDNNISGNFEFKLVNPKRRQHNMIKHISKTTILTLIMCLTALLAKAQLGFNYDQYDVGFGFSLNSVYGDAETSPMRPAVHFNLTFNATPYINYVWEAQIGQMAGGDSLTDKSGRQFASSFVSYQFRGQLQLGELIDYQRGGLANVVKNLYVSGGIGMVYDDITTINRYSSKVPGFYTGGDNSAAELFVPVRIGYEFKMYNSYNEPNIKIDIGYEYNHVFGDELDGFKTGTTTDTFTQVYIGVKFSIAGKTSYRKEIN